MRQASTAGAAKDPRVQVMVVQPGNEVAIGMQIPDPEQAERADLKGLSHGAAAAKLVEEASARDAARQRSIYLS